MQSPKLKALLENKRFVAIVGMLGSNGSGEAANAAAMATKMLQDAGVTWGELLKAQDGSAGYGGRDTHNATLQRLWAEQRRSEASETRARHAEENVRKLKRQLHEKTEEARNLTSMVRTLEAALKKANEQRHSAGGGGFRFTDVPGEDQRRAAPPQDDSFTPKTYREIHPWMERLVKEAWDDLSDWEVSFFTDFYEKKKAILSDKQYAVFKRVAVKTGLPLDF